MTGASYHDGLRRAPQWRLDVVVVPDIEAFFATLDYMLGEGLPKVAAMARRGALRLAAALASGPEGGTDTGVGQGNGIASAAMTLVEESTAELAELAIAADPLVDTRGMVSPAAIDRLVGICYHAACASARSACPIWRGVTASGSNLDVFGVPVMGIHDESGERFVRIRPAGCPHPSGGRWRSWDNLLALASWAGDGDATGALISFGRRTG